MATDRSERDGGGQGFAFDAFVRPSEPVAGGEVGRLVAEFLDAGGTQIDLFEASGAPAVDAWQRIGGVATAPAGSRALRFAVRHDDASPAEVFVDRASVRSLARQTAAVGDVVVHEGTGGPSLPEFRVTLACPADAALAVDYTTAAGSAAAGEDFTATSGLLAFAAGDLEASFTVEVAGDATDEDDESFSVVLSAAGDVVLLDRIGAATIVDDEGPAAVSVADTAVLESGAEAVFELTLSAPSGRLVTVDYATAAGSAVEGDFSAAAGTVTFAPGDTVVTVSVPVADDLRGEGDEDFRLLLSNPVHATLADAEAVATIRDDDEVGIAIGDAIVLEGAAGETTAVDFTATLSLVSDLPVEVAFATADVEALAGDDYVAASGTLTFAPGVLVRTLTVDGLGDNVVEDNETFHVLLSAPAGGVLVRPEGTGTLFDDDGILISAADVQFVEGEAPEVAVTVSLNRPSSDDVLVDFITTDDSALGGEDYSARSGTLTLPVGSVAQEIRIPIVDDVRYEPSESFTVTLTSPAGDELLDGEANVEIFDDDGWTLSQVGDANGVPDDLPLVPGCIALTRENGNGGGASAWRKVQLDR